jgi:hypothetical protein
VFERKQVSELAGCRAMMMTSIAEADILRAPVLAGVVGWSLVSPLWQKAGNKTGTIRNDRKHRRNNEWRSKSSQKPAGAGN